jgi:putative transposase
MDFVHDQLFDGKKIRVLTIVDTFTRLSPAIDVRRQYRGADVVDTLERAAQAVGCPKTIRVDNGPEFISRELDLWAFMRGVTLDFSRPGKPTDTDIVEKPLSRLSLIFVSRRDPFLIDASASTLT